jgi:hypothetical protein
MTQPLRPELNYCTNVVASLPTRNLILAILRVQVNSTGKIFFSRKKKTAGFKFEAANSK